MRSIYIHSITVCVCDGVDVYAHTASPVRNDVDGLMCANGDEITVEIAAWKSTISIRMFVSLFVSLYCSVSIFLQFHFIYSPLFQSIIPANLFNLWIFSPWKHIVHAQHSIATPQLNNVKRTLDTTISKRFLL